MTQLSSLSGKLILQQPFKWPLRLQSLPRQSTRPKLPDSSFSLLTPLVSGLSPPLQDVGHQAARPHPGSQGLPKSLLTAPCILSPKHFYGLFIPLCLKYTHLLLHLESCFRAKLNLCFLILFLARFSYLPSPSSPNSSH